MAESFQDDARETEMIELFRLVKDESEGRSGIDAYLELNGQSIPFELKTTSNSSVTTVRDFGPEHIRKWEGKHWLFGFYNAGRVYYKYGTPSMMKPWIDEKADYIATDFMLADILSTKLTTIELHAICGEKTKYLYNDALRIQKRQYRRSEYTEKQDMAGGYSPTRMLDILKDRAKYIIERGSTLNNPHIPAGYFTGWEEIINNHASRLREMVTEYLAQTDV